MHSPSIFHIAEDTCILGVNVIPHINQGFRREYPYVFSDDHLARDSGFKGELVVRPEAILFLLPGT